MPRNVEKSLNEHVTASKTIGGIVKSHYRPFTLERKLQWYTIMSRPLRGYVDCEDCVQALRDYIAKTTGRTIRLTVEMRNLLIHMYSLRHQYRDRGLVAMSSVFARKNHAHAVDHLRELLEESGLIRMVDGSWAYNPVDRQRNRAPKYRFTDEFISLLGIIHASYRKGKTNGRFAINRKAKNITIWIASPDIKNSNEERMKRVRDEGEGESRRKAERGEQVQGNRPIISDKAGANHKNHLEFVDTQGDTVMQKLMSDRERRERDKRLQKLWKGMSLPDMEVTGLKDRCRLQCVSLGMGAEVDDHAFISIMAERYREDMYAKIVRECDSIFPEYVKDKLTGASLGTHTHWSFLPKRDARLNIKKAGVRPCSDLCGTRNDDDSEIILKPSEVARSAMLKPLHLDYHFDVHCSIHNLGRSLALGKFDNLDIYGRVAKRAGVDRSIVKSSFMHACFGPLAEYCARHPNSEKANQFIHHRAMNKDTGERTNVALPVTYRQVQDAMRAENVPINGRYTEIFWHEAFIYDLVRLYLLREENIPSLRIYDSFYTRFYVKESEFISLINRALAEYLQIIAQ